MINKWLKENPYATQLSALQDERVAQNEFQEATRQAQKQRSQGDLGESLARLAGKGVGFVVGGMTGGPGGAKVGAAAGDLFAGGAWDFATGGQETKIGPGTHSPMVKGNQQYKFDIANKRNELNMALDQLDQEANTRHLTSPIKSYMQADQLGKAAYGTKSWDEMAKANTKLPMPNIKDRMKNMTSWIPKLFDKGVDPTAGGQVESAVDKIYVKPPGVEAYGQEGAGGVFNIKEPPPIDISNVSAPKVDPGPPPETIAQKKAAELFRQRQIDNRNKVLSQQFNETGIQNVNQLNRIDPVVTNKFQKFKNQQKVEFTKRFNNELGWTEKLNNVDKEPVLDAGKGKFTDETVEEIITKTPNDKIFTQVTGNMTEGGMSEFNRVFNGEIGEGMEKFFQEISPIFGGENFEGTGADMKLLKKIIIKKYSRNPYSGNVSSANWKGNLLTDPNVDGKLILDILEKVGE